MKIKLGYSMGYAGTETEWEEYLPEDIDPNNKEEVEAYLEDLQHVVWDTACQNISTWVKVVE